MVRRSVCVWTALVILGLSARADEDYLPAASLHEAGLLKSWQLSLRLASGQRLADMYLVNDQLYLATDDGYVYAMDAQTGATRWLRRVTAEGYRVPRPAEAGNRVIFATPTTVLQLDRLSGEGLLKMPLDFPAGTGPVSDGQRFFLGGLDRRIHAFEVENPLFSWQVVANGPIQSTPVVYNGNLYFASDDGSVYSCTARDKSFRWQSFTYGSVTADLVASQQGVYVASRDQSLYLFDLLFGQVRWRARFSGPLYEPPVLAAEVAYQYCPDDGLVAVETAITGIEERLRWKLPRGRRVLTVDDQHVYILSLDETILVARIPDGQVVHAVAAAGFTLGVAATEQTVLYVGTADGRIFCARPLGAPLVRPEDVRVALRPPEPPEPPRSAVEAPPTADRQEQRDPLGTSRPGLPIGGKSKVTKSFQESGGGTEGSGP